MQNNLKLSVIIPTYNRAEDLERCLVSLANQTYKDFETIVVDNGSTDETPEILKKYPVRVVNDAAKNVTHLFNAGWQNSGAEIIVFINDDAEAVPAWLENLLGTFERFKDAGAVGGPTILPEEVLNNQEMLRLHQSAKKNFLLKGPAWIYENLILEGKYSEVGALCESGAYSVGGSLLACTKLKEPFPVDLLSITNCAIKRSVLKELNGLDENFRFTHGDGDLFIRIKRAGYKLIFEPKAIVWHHVNPIGDTRGAFWRGRDQAYFLLKNIRPKSLTGWFKYFLNIIFFNIYWVYKAIESRDANFLKGISGFLKGISDYCKAKK